MPAFHYAVVGFVKARGTCRDCAHSPALNTKTSCSRFRCILGEFLVDLVLDVYTQNVLHALLMIRLWLLTNLLVPLLHALCYALLLSSVGVAFVLPAVGYALCFFFHHYSSAHSDSVLWVSSPIVHRHSLASCCVRQSGVASLVDFFSSLALLAVMLSLFCLSSIAAHRDLSHQCAARRLLRAVCSSSCTLWKFTTSIAQLRECWFAVGALAPREGSL